MAFQTAITRSPVKGVEGMLASTSISPVISSAIAKALVAPGRMVRVDAADAQDQVTVPTSAAQITGDATNGTCLGITQWDATALNNPFAAGDPLGIIRQGEVYVICETAVDPSLPVYVRHTANGGNTIIGGFSAVAGTGLALLPVGCARWMEKVTTVTSLVKLSVALP